MSRAMMLVALLAIWANAGFLLARQPDEWNCKPLEQLPEHVPAVQQKITLFADYDHPRKDGCVVVYLVNRTAEAITLKGQDGDLYLKLEYENEAGAWVRAQPHAYSWCGNSYHTREIEPQRFIEIGGYQPAKGEERTVRFKFYGQKSEWSSNSGPGLVSEEDVHSAASDAMVVKEGGFKVVSGVALGTIVLNNELDHMKDLQRIAFWKLSSGCFNTSQSRAVLQQAKEKFPERKEEIESALRHLERMAEKQIEN